MHVTYHFTVLVCRKSTQVKNGICGKSLHLMVTNTFDLKTCYAECHFLKFLTCVKIRYLWKTLQVKIVTCEKSLQIPTQITTNFLKKVQTVNTVFWKILTCVKTTICGKSLQLKNANCGKSLH